MIYTTLVAQLGVAGRKRRADLAPKEIALDTKCPLQHFDRLWKLSGLTFEACTSKCTDDQVRNYTRSLAGHSCNSTY